MKINPFLTPSDNFHPDHMSRLAPKKKVDGEEARRYPFEVRNDRLGPGFQLTHTYGTKDTVLYTLAPSKMRGAMKTWAAMDPEKRNRRRKEISMMYDKVKAQNAIGLAVSAAGVVAGYNAPIRQLLKPGLPALALPAVVGGYALAVDACKRSERFELAAMADYVLWRT